MKIYTLRNDFHNSVARVRLAPEYAFGLTLSQSQVRRIKNKLCGVAGCTCGGNLGECGPGNPEIETYQNTFGEISYRVIDPEFPEGC